ncbi:MAG: hypothetical protein HY784_15670 [Chloroflexi bacterium]|nr:hypothetical protein [Chloroflexota bacterium]
MNTPFDTNYTPPIPVLQVYLAELDEAPRVGPLSAIVDTGADGTLIPVQYLEWVEAVAIGDALIHGVLGESREVELFEVDLLINSLRLPGVIVTGDDRGSEILLGRNVLNKLILLLDGHAGETELFEQRPRWR